VIRSPGDGYRFHTSTGAVEEQLPQRLGPFSLLGCCIKREHQIKSGDSTDFQQVPGGSRHRHFSPSGQDFVVAGYESADPGAIKSPNTRQVEYDGALPMTKQSLHKGYDLLTLRSQHHPT